VVAVACPHVLTLNRSCMHALSCVAGRTSVVKPWEKDNAHGLEFDVMVLICTVEFDIVYSDTFCCRFSWF
jgi:hypothetical protein